MKNIFQSMLTACFFLTLTVSAQTEIDALRYSMINYGSTARSLGMGNAFGALGADISVMATNPAGIALFRRSEFSFSQTFTLRNVESNFNGTKTDDSKFNFNFGHFGAVWHHDNNEGNDWKGWTFGMSYNRLNDFGGNTTAEGINSKNSLLDSYLPLANGNIDSTLLDVFPFDVGLAYETFLLNSDSTFNNFTSVIPANNSVLQRRKVETRGGQGEWDFSFGTNYNDKLYFGFTLGITSVNYQEDLSWREEDVNKTIVSADSMYDFKSFTYTQSLKTEGSGVNGKFGIIYRPADYIRFGLAIHTPTSYLLSDQYRTKITAVFDNTSSPNQERTSRDVVPFDYRIITPFHALGSMAFIIGKQALISAEYEFTDYSQSNLKVKDKDIDVSFNDVNNKIKKLYTVSHNFKIGGEYRIDLLRFRAGASYATSPFKAGLNNDSKTDQSRYSVTGGFGLKMDNFYFDMAYAYSYKGSFFKQYTLPNGSEPGITESMIDNRLLFTVGFNF